MPCSSGHRKPRSADWLALWAVTVGGHLDGYWPAFDDGVRFVLVEGSIPSTTASPWPCTRFAHAIGVLASVGALVALLGRGGGRRPAAS